MKSKYKKIFILGSYHGNNFGDLEILDSILSKLHRDFKITLLSKSGFKIRTKLASQYFETGMISFVNPFNYIKVLFNIIKADVLIIGGGGLFFSHSVMDTLKVKGRSQLIYWLKCTILAKLLGKKVYWFGVGMGPFESFGNKLMYFTSKFVDRIFVRDQASYSIMQSMVDKARLKLASDVVFSKYDTRKIKKSLAPKSQYTKNKILIIAFEKDNNLPKLEKMLTQLKTHNFKLTIASSNPDKDNKFNKTLSQKLKIDFLDTTNLTIAEFRNIFSRYELVISMRMHPLLMAFQQGTPGIGLADKLPKIVEIQDQLYSHPLYTTDYEVDNLVIDAQKIMLTNQNNLLSYYAENYTKADKAFTDIISLISR